MCEYKSVLDGKLPTDMMCTFHLRAHENGLPAARAAVEEAVSAKEAEIRREGKAGNQDRTKKLLDWERRLARKRIFKAHYADLKEKQPNHSSCVLM
jgi:hypothetical protein